MIVRQFLHWVRTAPAGERAEATGALARSYLYSDLPKEDRAAAEGAMIMLLDDPSPLVRQALAEALAGSADAPHAVIHALASDHADIAALVLARSPLLIDAELVGIVASGSCGLQTAIASRAPLQSAVVAALAEVGAVEAFRGRGAAGFRAVYEKAGMPASVFPAFREAVTALREADGEDAVSSRLKRHVVERVLAQCEHVDVGDIEPLLILLRRYAAEAAREDARAYCEELVADERLAGWPER